MGLSLEGFEGSSKFWGLFFGMERLGKNKNKNWDYYGRRDDFLHGWKIWVVEDERLLWQCEFSCEGPRAIGEIKDRCTITLRWKDHHEPKKEPKDRKKRSPQVLEIPSISPGVSSSVWNPIYFIFSISFPLSFAIIKICYY